MADFLDIGGDVEILVRLVGYYQAAVVHVLRYIRHFPEPVLLLPGLERLIDFDYARLRRHGVVVLDGDQVLLYRIECSGNIWLVPNGLVQILLVGLHLALLTFFNAFMDNVISMGFGADHVAEATLYLLNRYYLRSLRCPRRRRCVGVAHISFIARLINALRLLILLLCLRLVVLGSRQRIPFARIQLLLHRLRKHLRRLLVLQAAVGERILQARDLALLALLEQVRIIDHYFQGRPAHLNVVVDVLLHDDGLPYLDQSAKLRLVVLDVEVSSGITVYAGVETGDGDVRDSDVGIVASADADVVSVLHIYDVHDTNVLQRDTLEHDVVLLRQFVLKNLDWLAHPLVPLPAQLLVVGHDGAVGEDLSREAHFTQFALERLPAVGLDAVALLLGPLGIEPFSEAFKMNVAHGTGAFAWRYQWIIPLVLLAEADAAHLVLGRQFCLLH